MAEVKKTIEISCEGKAKMDIADMREFQGNLKSLSEADYEKLKGEMIEHGFSFPIAIWNNGKQNFILDGHQRRRVLLKMKEEGWVIPKLPVSITHAKTLKEAKLKLLGAASQYGQITPQGLYEYVSESDISVEEMIQRHRLPEIDLNMFNAEFFHDLSIDTSGAVDPDKLGDYEGDKDFFSVRVNDVVPDDKEAIVELINKAIEKAGYTYSAEAF